MTHSKAKELIDKVEEAKIRYLYAKMLGMDEDEVEMLRIEFKRLDEKVAKQLSR